MKLLTYIVLALQYPIQSLSMKTNMLFVEDYLKFNNIQICVFLGCENITDRIKNRIHFQHNDVWINWWGISQRSELHHLDYTNTFMRLGSPVGVVIHLECDRSLDLLKEVSSRKLFHYERFWLIFGKTYDQAYDMLKNQCINMDAEIRLALPDNEKYICDKKIRRKNLIYFETRGYHVYDVFNPSFVRGGKLNVTKIGHWNSINGYRLSTWETKIERRHDLKQLWFHTATAIPSVPKNKSFMEHLESDEYPFIDSGDKNNYRLLELVKEMFNFNFLVHRASVWGILNPNGTWKGVIGMLSRDEIDFAVPAFRWANERYGAFDHTTHSYQIKYVFMFLHPKTVHISRVYLSPFTTQVWVLILAISIAISCALRKAFWAENQFNVHLTEPNECTYSSTSLMVLGFVVQQGYSGNALLLSSRILTTAILIFSIVTFQFYSSSIVASLLIESPKSIKTMRQLLNSDLICYIDEVAYIRDHIEHFNEESVIKMYNKITAHPNPFVSLDKGVELVKQGGHAFYTDGNHGYQVLEEILTDQQKCDLQEVKYVQKVPGGPGVPKKSPFRELLKISLRRITETGLLAYNWQLWIGHKPKCDTNAIDVVPVDILHFSSALFLLFLGMQISLGILLGEWFINRRLNGIST